MNVLTPHDAGVTVPMQPKVPPSPGAAVCWLVISLTAPASTFIPLGTRICQVSAAAVFPRWPQVRAMDSPFPQLIQMLPARSWGVCPPPAASGVSTAITWRAGAGQKLSSSSSLCCRAAWAGRGACCGRALQKAPQRQREPPLCRNLPVPVRAEPLMTSPRTWLHNSALEETLTCREPAPGHGGDAL